MAKFALDQLHAKKVAVLQDVKSDYSQGLAKFFSDYFKAHGGEIVSDRFYSGGGTDRDFRAQLNGFRPNDWMQSLFETVRELDPVDAAMSVDVRSYLPYDLLVKVDITSMANSLEARSPFLDHDVMEFAARIFVASPPSVTSATKLIEPLLPLA